MCSQASDPATSIIVGLLGIVLEGVDALVGLDCSPITVIGVGTGNSCDANVVCCQNNNVVRALPPPPELSNAHYLLAGRPHLHWLRPHHPLGDSALLASRK